MRIFNYRPSRIHLATYIDIMATLQASFNATELPQIIAINSQEYTARHLSEPMSTMSTEKRALLNLMEKKAPLKFIVQEQPDI